MAAKQFIVDDFKKNVANGNIDLVNDTIKAALCEEFSPSYSAWASETSYSEGDIVVPSSRNGHRYRAKSGGDSGTDEPTWPTSAEATVTDGDITWEEYGGEHADNEFWDDVSGNEVSDGDGYSEGGESLGSKAVDKDSDDPMATQWDAGDVTWTSLTKTMRTAWLYVDGDTAGDNDYLISYILLDDDPADMSVSGVDFTLQWNADGIIELGR